MRQINYLQQNTGNILQFQGDTTWTQRSNINGDSTRAIATRRSCSAS